MNYNPQNKANMSVHTDIKKQLGWSRKSRRGILGSERGSDAGASL